jgi:hypothetical protein
MARGSIDNLDQLVEIGSRHGHARHRKRGNSARGEPLFHRFGILRPPTADQRHHQQGACMRVTSMITGGERSTSLIATGSPLGAKRGSRSSKSWNAGRGWRIGKGRLATSKQEQRCLLDRSRHHRLGTAQTVTVEGCAVIFLLSSLSFRNLKMLELNRLAVLVIFW